MTTKLGRMVTSQLFNHSINQSMYFNERLKLHNLQMYINIFYFLHVTLMINVIIKTIGCIE